MSASDCVTDGADDYGNNEDCSITITINVMLVATQYAIEGRYAATPAPAADGGYSADGLSPTLPARSGRRPRALRSRVRGCLQPASPQG